MTATGKSSIEALTCENVDTWKLRMEALLIKCDLWEYVNGQLAKPKDAAAGAAWLKKDLKAKAEIILNIAPSDMKKVQNCATSREVWLKLQSIYNWKNPARKVELLTQVAFSKMNEGSDVREHLNWFFDTVEELSEMNVDINKDLLSILLLHSLPGSFEQFRSGFKGGDLPEPHVLKGMIVKESESRRKSRKTPRKREDDQESKNARLATKSKCYRCGKMGHRALQCPSIRQTQEADQEDNEADTLEACFDSLDTSYLGDKWGLDCGGTSQEDSRFFPRSRKSDGTQR